MAVLSRIDSVSSFLIKARLKDIAFSVKRARSD